MIKDSGKKVIWDLFGGGCNSVTNMLIKKKLISEYMVYTFDVVPKKDGQIKHTNHKYIEIDLACGMKIGNTKHSVNGFKKIIDLFESLNLPKPDIIVASPLCQSFSSVLSLIGGGVHAFERNKIPKIQNQYWLKEVLKNLKN